MLALIILVVCISANYIFLRSPELFEPSPVGAYPYYRKAGHGTLRDSGPSAAIDRFVIDLPVIDQRANLAHSYTLEHLPEEEMVVGIRMLPAVRIGESAPSTEPSIELSLALEDETGAVVFAESGAINEWDLWIIDEMPRFYFRSGNWEDSISYAGKTQKRRAGVGADQGWGTKFVPRRNGVYRLTFRFSGPIEQLDAAKLWLGIRGGGWKQ